MIYLLTGNGKGKTTSAIGMAIRALGAGKRVLMIQFLKDSKISSEFKILKKLNGFKIKSFGRKGFFVPSTYLKDHPELKKSGVKPFAKIDKILAKNGLDFAKEAAESKKYDLIILDEINIAIYYRLISQNEVMKLVKRYRENMDFILTGRYAKKGIIKCADLVTEMREVKHYYRQGKKARFGIEF